MGLFILWVTALSVVYITNTICDKITSKKAVKEEVTIKDIEQVTEDISTTKELLPKEEIVFNEDVTKIPEVIQTVEEVSSDTNIETNDRVTFNDILNGLVPVTYYDNEINNQNYNITNPQEIYEGNYNNLKLELEKNTIKKVEPIMDKISEVKEVEDVPKVKIEKIPEIKVNIIKAKDIINNDTLNINLDTVEDKTLKIKKDNMKKNLISNTISLNDLIKQDEEIKETSKVIDTINDESYSLNDYKKIVEMLKEIKNNSNKNNISIDDAVTMSLINNYSIDDCVKFKEILESNLN